MKFISLFNNTKKVGTLLIFLLVIFSALVSVRQLFLGGYFESHDGIIHVMRLAHFYEAVKSGNLIVRWLDTWMAGYGSPLFIFNWSLPYYAGILFYFMGFSLAGSIKIVFILASLLSAGFCFFLIKEITENNWASAAGAVAYTWAPYKFTDIFIRGALGEACAFLFFPLLFWLVIRAIKNESRVPWWSSLLWAAFILTHNIMSILGVVFFLVYLLYVKFFSNGAITAVKSAFLTLIFGIFLTAYFWLPALAEKRYDAISNLSNIYQTIGQFPTAGSLLFSKWQYAYAHPDNQQFSMSFEVGLVHLTISFIAGLIAVWQIRKFKEDRNLNQIFFTGLFLISIIFSLKISQPIYKIFHIGSFVNFPWRFLEIVTFASSVLIGIFISYFRKFSWIIALFTVVLIIALSWRYSRIVSWRVNLGDAEYFSMVKTNINYLPDTEYLPKNAQYLKLLEEKGPAYSRSLFEDLSGEAMVFNERKNTKEVQIVNQKNTTIRANIFYFPGWRVYDNQKLVEAAQDEYGLISFNLEPAPHRIKLRFEETLIRKVGDVISTASMAFLVILLLLRRRFI